LSSLYSRLAGGGGADAEQKKYCFHPIKGENISCSFLSVLLFLKLLFSEVQRTKMEMNTLFLLSRIFHLKKFCEEFFRSLFSEETKCIRKKNKNLTLSFKR
jgi:hypothetical protein